MVNLCIINGSPRKGQGTSAYLISELKKLLNSTVSAKEYYISNLIKDLTLLDELTTYDKIIFISPLYADCFPSTLLEFMAIFEDYIKEKSHKKVDMYCLVNCGFIEGFQNRTAINIMKNYCNKLNFNWRFGVGIGGGEFMKDSIGMPINSRIKKPVYDALIALKADIESSNHTLKNDIMANAKIPRFIFKLAGNSGWKSMAKENKLNPKDLYKKLY